MSRIISLVVAAGLLAGMTFAVLATAQSQQPDNSRHLLLVPTDAEGTAALARTDARVLASYESFSLVEAQGGDDARLRGAGAERRDDMRRVETAAGEIDPSIDRSSLAAKDGPDRDETLALVQFVGPPKEAWLERLRDTGAQIVTYQAENAYVVHARGRAVDRVAALQGGYPAVRAVSVLTAADKLEDRSSGSGVFAVTTVTGTAGEEARDKTARAGPMKGGAPITVGAVRTDYRALSSSQTEELAKDPGVVAIEASADPELLDERAAQIVAGNLNGVFGPTDPSYLDWVVDPARIPDQSTFDFAIDVTDVGFDNGADPPAHEDFYRLGSNDNSDRVAYVADYIDGDRTPATAAATARTWPRSPRATTPPRAPLCGRTPRTTTTVSASRRSRRSAPRRSSAATADFSSSWTPADGTADAYGNGARISNNSWGVGKATAWGDYSARSAAYDELVRDARPGDGRATSRWSRCSPPATTAMTTRASRTRATERSRPRARPRT